MCKKEESTTAKQLKVDANDHQVDGASLLPGQPMIPSGRDPRLDIWPEDDQASSCYNIFTPWKFLSTQWKLWSFAYMKLVLDKGAKQNKADGHHLTAEDLFVVPQAMKSHKLVQAFENEYNYPLKTSSRSPSNQEPFLPPPSSYKRLIHALWKIGAPTFIPAGFCELLVVLCGTATPLIVRELLGVLEDNPGQNVVQDGLSFAISLFVVSILNGFGNHRHRHLALKTGVALRAAVVNILYEHVLRLSPEGRRGLTSGEVTNLVAVDAQKLFEVTQEAHLIWALPLSIVLVSFFLYRTLGPSTLVGIVVLVAFVPIIQKVSERMLAVRQKRVIYTDQRVEIVSTMLQGIKVTKLNNYESNYLDRVTEVRNQELKYLSQEMAIWATTLLMTVSSSVIATGAAFATYVLIDESNILTAADTFGVLLLFSALRFPINFAGRLIGKATQAISALKRISSFLNRPLRARNTISLRRDDSNEKDETERTEQLTGKPGTSPGHRNFSGSDRLNMNSSQSQLDVEDDVPLTLLQASFRVGEAPPPISIEEIEEDWVFLETIKAMSGGTVGEFNFSIAKGQVLAVCGPVGSGKSTLLNGILDEAAALGNTEVFINGSISYVPQTPFILNQTVRDNILFGLPFDPERYNQVLDACALRPDLEQLGAAGDLTEIGERGVTLSGGQKQRVSLARAAYSKSSLYILDDPFSALDSGTGKAVFERLIAAPGALLKDSAVLLVTHASHFITNRAVDKILLIVDGTNQFLGSWEEMACFHPTDENTARAVEHIKSSVREDTEEDDAKAVDVDVSKDVDNVKKERGRLIQVEQREHGLSNVKTWLLWFKRAGGWKFMTLQVLFMFFDRLFYVAVELFLAKWTSAADGPIEVFGIGFPAQTDGRSAQGRYLRVYLSLILVSFVVTAIRSEWAVTGGVRATRNVFQSMLKSVLTAPMSYFETVPMGRILNRFTYDTDINDITLTQVMSMFMISCSWYVAGVCIQCTILPWSALAIFPVSVMYWILMLHYRMSGPDLQRIDALSRSPLQSMVTECLEGSTSIRVFLQDSNFVSKYRRLADINSAALLNFVSAQRWLGARMELLGSIVVLVSAVMVVCLNEVLGLDPGLAGLLILWSSNFTVTLNFMVDTFSETEAAVTAIERVDAMADLPKEKPMETNPEDAPSEDWPNEGLLQFDSVSLRYREGLPLALDGLSFQIPAGRSCGVVGRTGAGKSSIAVALFRLVEIEGGQILLDGKDLSKLGLADVRGRGMSIIPQDPFLAGATLRECLDPFRQHSNEEIVEALQAVRLGSSNPYTDEDSLLSTKLEEGGSNYSVGERQLLNLARALLVQPKLLVLDEATASIDGETDAFIQKMLRTRFPQTTLVTIAHRLNTIMDNDLVLVMDAGKAVEFGSPSDLLADRSGVFSELVDATGAESSQALRELAVHSQTSKP